MTVRRAVHIGLAQGFAVVLAAAGPVTAQEVDRGTAVLRLPRPGYEPRTFRFEGVTVAPQVAAEGHYDSNVYATSRDADDDFVYNVSPRIDIDASRTNLALTGDVYGNFRGHAENTREDSTTFGAGAAVDYKLASVNRLTGAVRYARAVESRTDPEANIVVTDPPSKIDLLSAEIGYGYRRSRVGLSVNASLQSINYLPTFERDRDLTSYRGAGRISVRLSPRFDVFVEGYGNRRDARLSIDRSGLDRDATTLGVIAGASVDIAQRWSGGFGAGVFRADPDDPALRRFSGFAANGSITWSPDERTAVTAAAFSGDVATIRAGASGRIDQRLSLRIDQEARHNLLWNTVLGVRRTYYRGGLDRRQTTASIGFGVEYLLNGQWSVTADATFARRSSQVDDDEFERGTAGLGLRLRY